MRVWWNHWFSSAYHLINMMKDDRTDIAMIGSNTNYDCVYKTVCDEWYNEPDVDNENDYADHCINFCKEKNIDIFVPRRGLTDIIRNKKLFIDNNVRLLANTVLNDLEITDNKTLTYNYLRENGLGEYVPDHFICNDFLEAKQSVEHYIKKGIRTCFKLVCDEGAMTYHLICDSSDEASIFKKSSSNIPLKKAFDIFENYDFSKQIMVMPHLDSPEISVDCIEIPKGLVMISRYKLGGRVSEIRYDKEIIEMTEKISRLFSFDMPYNIQYRMYNGRPYLLEINPRMSGGLQLSCKGAHINIPKIALSKLLNEDISYNYPSERIIKVAHVETPIII